jgi:hypothetical protein
LYYETLLEVKGVRRRSVAAVARLRRLLGTHGDRIVFLTGLGSRKARNLAVVLG